MGNRGFPYHTHQGSVVREFTLGSARIKICDDFCRNLSKTEIETRLGGLARQILREYVWDATRGASGCRFSIKAPL
jgi:hypothetical protein